MDEGSGRRRGEIAVIFVSTRTAGDAAGYAEAAAALDALAAGQPGYRGIDGVRGADGVGITVSYWADAAAAIAWRDHPVHVRIREEGRRRWYARYEVSIARIERAYRWSDGDRAAAVTSAPPPAPGPSRL